MVEEKKGLLNKVIGMIADSRMGDAIVERVQQAVPAKSRPQHDRSVIQGGLRDRMKPTRQEILRNSLEAWRENPLAKRYVSTMKQYIAGDGLVIESEDEQVNKFLNEWWNHPENRMEIRAGDMAEELIRAGNIFPLLTTNAEGMTYIRLIPASDGKCYGVKDIKTAENDSENVTTYLGYNSEIEEGPAWKPYKKEDDKQKQDGSFNPVMVHYALNKVVGAAWGESDLYSILKWMRRYSDWLERRVQLNFFRTIFAWVLKGKYKTESQRKEREREVNANKPSPNSILVCDESEEWDVLEPKLNSGEAGKDGMAVKKMVAVGMGFPMHFLAEPESATRTTAEQSGGPTYRFFKDRQTYFLYCIYDLARIALRRRAMVDDDLDGEAAIEVRGGDISARDNTALSLSASRISKAAVVLRDRELIDDEELMRLFYKFTGEAGQVDINKLLERGERAGPPKMYGFYNPASAANQEGESVDKEE